MGFYLLSPFGCNFRFNRIRFNTLIMITRQCLECGGELVMAFRPSENIRLRPGAGSNAKWRCSTCGQAFTAEQLRANKRTNSKVVEQT
jgi:hypothetical protein